MQSSGAGSCTLQQFHSMQKSRRALQHIPHRNSTVILVQEKSLYINLTYRCIIYKASYVTLFRQSCGAVHPFLGGFAYPCHRLPLVYLQADNRICLSQPLAVPSLLDKQDFLILAINCHQSTCQTTGFSYPSHQLSLLYLPDSRIVSGPIPRSV